MGRSIKDIRVAGKIAVQYRQEIEGIVRNIVGHGAMYAIEPDALLEFFIGDLANRLLQKRKSLGTAASFGQTQGTLRFRWRRPTRMFRHALRPRGRPSDQKRQRQNDTEME